MDPPAPIRLLTPADVPSLMSLKDSAGWNQTAADFHGILQAEPGGCFGIEEDGRIIASTTALRYGRDLAWIGMVLTLPSHRGRGLARALMTHAMDWLQAEEVGWAKLDATAMGEPLYRSLGFEVECPIERWIRRPAELQVEGAAAEPLTRIPPIDREAFGVNRETYLARIQARGEPASLGKNTFAMGRPGSQCWYFGPCVSDDPAKAAAIARWFIARHAHESVFWDLLPQNTHAAAIASELGFRCVRELKRMSRPLAGVPSEIPMRTDLIYAICGFEAG